MHIPKFGFSISLVAFLLPFLLVTCNDKTTKELKPLVMQDQLVYTIQGYKILTNSFDKSEKSDAYGYGSQDYSGISTLYGSSSEKPVWMRLLLFAVFITILAGLVFQFFIKLEMLRKKISILSASVAIALLLIFYIFLEYTISSKQAETMDAFSGEGTSAFGSSYLSTLGNIEYTIGLGSGFYLCLLGLLIVLYYYLFFIKKYSIVRSRETIALETQAAPAIPGEPTN
jgi:hypothetical protein